MRNRMRDDVNRKSLIQTIAGFVQKILPSTAPLIRGTPKRELLDFRPPPSKTVSPSIKTLDTMTVSPSSASTSREIIYETPKLSMDTDEIEEDDVGDVTEKGRATIRH
jgi:hypothetical protein